MSLNNDEYNKRIINSIINPRFSIKDSLYKEKKKYFISIRKDINNSDTENNKILIDYLLSECEYSLVEYLSKYLKIKKSVEGYLCFGYYTFANLPNSLVEYLLKIDSVINKCFSIIKFCMFYNYSQEFFRIMLSHGMNNFQIENNIISYGILAYEKMTGNVLKEKRGSLEKIKLPMDIIFDIENFISI